jgi:hypothetical protein
MDPPPPPLPFGGPPSPQAAIEDRTHDSGRAYIKKDGRIISSVALFREMLHGPCIFNTLEISCKNEQVFRCRYQKHDSNHFGPRGYYILIGGSSDQGRKWIEDHGGSSRAQAVHFSEIRKSTIREILSVIMKYYSCFYNEVRADILNKMEELDTIQRVSTKNGESANLRQKIPNNVLASQIAPYSIGPPPYGPNTNARPRQSIDQIRDELLQLLDFVNSLRGDGRPSNRYYWDLNNEEPPNLFHLGGGQTKLRKSRRNRSFQNSKSRKIKNKK